MPITYESHWWVWAIRGVLAILFGVLTFTIPAITLGFLILLFGVWAIIDGITHLVIAGRSGAEHRGLHIAEGLIGIFVGIVAFVWPLTTGIALIYLIAVWAILSGIARIALAFRLHGSPSREWLIGLSGAAAIFFGVVILFAPIIGALAIAIWIGIYAVFAGFIFIGTAIRMRSRHVRLLPA